jgi:5-formyltetrahydrofolate cyclo-ligase
MKEHERSSLRKQILGRRDQLSKTDRHMKSRAIMHNFLTLPELGQLATLFIYANFRSEVETFELIARCLNQGKRVAVPLVEASTHSMLPLLIKDPENDLVPGYYGIPEPDPKKCPQVEAERIDIAVIPGSVFDVKGGRLGYGGGYYDRFLLNDAPQATRIGFAFELQVVEQVPLLAHDQPLDILVTEKRIVDTRHQTERSSRCVKQQY